MRRLWGNGTDYLSFEGVLSLEASRILGQLMNSGELSDREEQEVRTQVRNAAKRLDDSLTDEALDAAIQAGELRAIGAIIRFCSNGWLRWHSFVPRRIGQFDHRNGRSFAWWCVCMAT